MSLNNSPLISVIIPFYNHNHFIKKTLDSVLEDTYPNKEIIIINDGSSNPDDSNITKWIEQHKDEVSVQYSKRENRGLTKTLNELIGLSNGKYIIVCASDDYFINNTFSDRVQLLENSKNKKIVLADNVVINNDGEIIYKSNLFEARKHKISNYLSDFGLKRMIVKKWGFAGPCWLASKELFAEIGLFDEALIVEDWDFFLRFVCKDLAIFYPDKKVSAYRIHENNTISNPDKQQRMWEDLYYTAKKHIKSFRNPYFKYIMWKNSRKNLKKVKHFKLISK